MATESLDDIRPLYALETLQFNAGTLFEAFNLKQTKQDKINQQMKRPHCQSYSMTRQYNVTNTLPPSPSHPTFFFCVCVCTGTKREATFV